MSIENFLISISNNVNQNLSILDIGANVGSFSKFCKQIWPSSNILMIEGNKNCEEDLAQTKIPFIIELLGSSEKEVEFYTDPKNSKGTGASYYKERTFVYKNPVVEKRTTKTLDEIISSKFDLIKIDTQGSELDIIVGGKKTISSAQAIILELPILEYNAGSPKISQIISQMDELGFSTMRIIDRHRWPHNDGTFEQNAIIQIDAIFTK